MKIVILDGYTENPGDLSWGGFEELGETIVYDRTPAALAAKRIGDAQAVLTNKTVISEEIMNACPKLKYIGVLATGYDVVDINGAKKRGITVTNIPSYGSDTVGQFAIGLLLEICHHIGHHDRTVHDGKWENCRDWCYWDYPLIELSGKTMGVIGFGRIGQVTGKLAAAFGMKVLACDEYPNENGRQIAEYVDMNRLFAESDVIALHCPLTTSTDGLINKETIGMMKDGVIIINNSRGPLICEPDLAEALNCGKVFAAGVDVVSTEPIRGDNPLLTAKNCIITPHMSWGTKESRKRLMDIAVGNLKGFLNVKPLNVVNE